jgi:hypothetical protein
LYVLEYDIWTRAWEVNSSWKSEIDYIIYMPARIRHVVKYAIPFHLSIMLPNDAVPAPHPPVPLFKTLTPEYYPTRSKRSLLSSLRPITTC